MKFRIGALIAFLLLAANLGAGNDVEKIKNDKVRVVEQTIVPGETVNWPVDHPTIVVWLEDGSVQTDDGKTQPVKRGEVAYQPAQASTTKNGGSAALKLVRIEYLGKGSSETWGNTGLAPNYKVLIENQFGRIYDIKIPAGAFEPQHTHHDRVVVCLSGAELEHIMPDGKKESSSLKTGEIAWRLGATHVGHNIGKTDLWVIAIEPK